MKRTPLQFAALLLTLSLCICSAAAADADPTQIFPTEIRESQSGEFQRVEKIYVLDAAADPTAIPTQSFEREGVRYSLLDLLREGHTETEAKSHTETVTKSSDTQDMAKILERLDAAIAFSGEDGFCGTLTLDPKSITVAAAGYQSSSKTVTASRTYPGLSSADAAFVPKTIQENGRTLELSDVSWQTTPGSNEAQPATFTASATYSGTATSRYASGYTITARYAGEVTRTISGNVVYTAIFTGKPVEPPIADPQEAVPMWACAVLIALTVLLALAVITLFLREINRRKELKSNEKMAANCITYALPECGTQHPGGGAGV